VGSSKDDLLGIVQKLANAARGQDTSSLLAQAPDSIEALDLQIAAQIAAHEQMVSLPELPPDVPEDLRAQVKEVEARLAKHDARATALMAESRTFKAQHGQPDIAQATTLVEGLKDVRARITEDNAELAKLYDQVKALLTKNVPASDETIRAFVRHENGNSLWIGLEKKRLAAHIKQVMSGEFEVITWENVAPGVDFSQIVARTNSTAPTIWLRSKSGVTGAPAGKRKMQLPGGKFVSMPLTHFKPESAESLQDSDVELITAYFYTRKAVESKLEETAQEEVPEGKGLPPADKSRFPEDSTRKCVVGSCNNHALEYFTYCLHHTNERCASMPHAKFIRTIARAGEKPAPPCFRCGKFGARARYLVNLAGKERDVCMDCGDEMRASPLFVEAKQGAALSTGEVDKATHEAIIAAYLQLSEHVLTAARGNEPNAVKIWPKLRDAVIFEMPPVAYTTLHNEFQRYVLRSARVDPDVPYGDHTKAQLKRVGEVLSSARDAPFPEKLPFTSSFFAYGGGVPENAAGYLVDGKIQVDDARGKLYGHLVSADGSVISFRRIVDGSRESNLLFQFEREGHGHLWSNPHLLTPWLVNALVSYVNEHKTLIEAGRNGFGYQTLIKKTSKQLNIKPPVPPPFYVVYMKDEFIREQVQRRGSEIKRHIEWQHRWKVRGHDCVRFTRGPLPLDPELEKELLARKYKVFTVEQPDSETFMALAKRGVPPKGVDEWIAVLSYWRKDFEKGPVDKPMVESVRRSTKKWAETKESEPKNNGDAA